MRWLVRRLSLVVLLSACSEPVLTKVPILEVTALQVHDDGLAEGEAPLATACLEHSEPATVEWLLDGVLLEDCGGLVPAGAGDTDTDADCDGDLDADLDTALSCELPPLDAGPHALRIEATSGSERTFDELTFDVSAGLAPTVEITAPDGSRRLYAGSLVELSALIADGDDPVLTVELAWSSSLDGALDPDGTATTDGLWTGFGTLTEGEHALVATATDPLGHTGSDSIIVQVGPPNHPPDCEILAPAQGSGLRAGLPIELVGTASDPDVAADALVATWSSSVQGLLGTLTPTTGGDVLLPLSSLDAGAHLLTLQVIDDDGATCTDSVVVQVSTPPQVVITDPLDGTRTPAGTLLLLQGVVTDAEDPGADLDVTWSSSIDGTLGEVVPDGLGQVVLPTSTLSRGAHALTLRAIDPAGLDAIDVITLVVDGPPGAPVVDILPRPATSVDDLLAVVLVPALDVEHDPVTLVWSWQRDGVPTGITSQRVPASQTTRGEVWRVQATPDDGLYAGPSGEAEITISNAPPVMLSAAIDPASPDGRDLLLCQGSASDADDDTITLTWRWTIDGLAATTGPTLAAGAAARGQEVVCHVTPFDGYEVGAELASPPVIVGNTPPEAEAPSIEPPFPYAADPLSCVPGATFDLDGDPVTLRTSWEVSGLLLAATGPTLAPGVARAGDVVRCAVTPDDGLASGATVWSGPVSVQNAAPAIATAWVQPTDPTSSDPLSCHWDAPWDPDGDPVVVTLRWYVDGLPDVEASAVHPPLSRGTRVSCAVTPDDGLDQGAPATSPEVVVGNSPPVVASAAILPPMPTSVDALTADALGITDADGDPVSLSWTWVVAGGAPIDGPALGPAAFARGDLVEAVVVPDDGLESGRPVAAPPVTIGNSPPTAPALVVAPPMPAGGYDDLVCRVIVPPADPDGDAVHLTLTWTVDGQPFAGAASTDLLGDTVPAASTRSGELWRCTATPDDGLIAGPSAWAEALTACVPQPLACDARDDDCDGTLHDGFPETDGDLTPDCVDNDIDGDGADAGVDCDDFDPTIHPGADEICDGRDQDCDGQTDEGVTSTWYADADQDGFGSAFQATQACTAPPGSVADGTDCDDGDGQTWPGAPEVCDGADDDCDGQIDEGVLLTWWIDQDGDGAGGATTTEACQAPGGYTGSPGDCDDGSALRTPGRAEICDGVDNDCDLVVDDGATLPFWPDLDGDGWGAGSAVQACQPPPGHVDRSGDCDDLSALRTPGRAEVCDGLDNDCNFVVDDGVLPTWYRDVDGDGWGGGATTQACTLPPGFSDRSDDCDDSTGLRHPGRAEVCDGLDNDCDFVVDEGVLSTWCRDADGDGHGTSGSTTQACTQPGGWVAACDDCDDGTSLRRPGRSESCDGLDNDCDFVVDEGVLHTYWLDDDDDGFGDPGVSTQACSVPGDYEDNNDDCYDRSKLIRPGIIMSKLRRMYSPAKTPSFPQGRSDHNVLREDLPEFQQAQEVAHGSYRVEGTVGWSIVQFSGSDVPPSDLAGLVVPVQRWYDDPEDHAFSATTTRPSSLGSGYNRENIYGYVAKADVTNLDSRNMTRHFYQLYHAPSIDHMMLLSGESESALIAAGWSNSDEVGWIFTEDFTCP